jgi:hypothetical protein
LSGIGTVATVCKSGRALIPDACGWTWLSDARRRAGPGALRHVPIVLGLASPLLLAATLGQFDHIDALSRTTRYAKL